MKCFLYLARRHLRTKLPMFYILGYGKGYNISIRVYPLFDINVYATPTIVLGIKPGT